MYISGFISLESAVAGAGLPGPKIVQIADAMPSRCVASIGPARRARHSGSGTPEPRPADNPAIPAMSCAGQPQQPLVPGSGWSASGALCGCGRERYLDTATCRSFVRSCRTAPPNRRRPVARLDRSSHLPGRRRLLVKMD